MCLVLACVLLVGTVTLVASLHQSRASSCDSRQSSPRQATLRSLIFSSSANRLLKKPDRAQPNLLEPDGVVGSVSRSKLPVQATLFDVSVPHTIWQTARSREDTPEFGTELFNSWTTKNPGYDHYFMDDEDIEAFIAAHYNDTVLQTFKEMPLGVMKADVFRYAHPVSVLQSSASDVTAVPLDTCTPRRARVWWCSGHINGLKQSVLPAHPP